MSKINLAAAQAFHTELATALKAVPANKHDMPYADYETRVQKLRAITALIESKGGTVAERWDGTKVRAFGINAASTSGLETACRNWISQLTVKSMAAQTGGAA